MTGHPWPGHSWRRWGSPFWKCRACDLTAESWARPEVLGTYVAVYTAFGTVEEVEALAECDVGTVGAVMNS
jgi:hypothetical protein